MSSPSGLTDADVTRILELVDRLHDVEVRIEVEGMKLHLRKFASGVAQAVQPTIVQDSRESSRIAGAEVQLSPLPQAPAEVSPRNLPRGPAKGIGTTAIPAGAIAIRAPMLGRFFRAPSPTEPTYVEVGSKVEPADTVCVIEVMKLFNTVKAGVRGTIVGVEVENGAMVEHDSVLFLVMPA